MTDQNQVIQQVQLKRLANVASNKQDLYKLLQNFGMILSDIKSPICSNQFLKNIVLGQQWCPYINNTSRVVYLRDVNKNDQVQEVNKLLKYLKGNLKVQATSASKQWLIDCLVSLAKDPKFFAKNYEAKQNIKKNEEQLLVDIIPGILDNYQVKQTKNKRKTGKINWLKNSQRFRNPIQTQVQTNEINTLSSELKTSKAHKNILIQGNDRLQAQERNSKKQLDQVQQLPQTDFNHYNYKSHQNPKK